MSAALVLSGLAKRFRRGPWSRQAPVAAVAGVDLTIERGEVVGLIGESGSGKTTLARLATGLLQPDDGKVEVLGTDLSTLGTGELRRFRRRFQLLFQDASAHLNPGLRVSEILRGSARLHRPEAPPGAVVDDALERVGLVHRRDAWPHQLSGGEQRRVGLAQVHIADPELIVADEPTAGLDAALKADLIDLLLSRRDSRRGYMLISHDLPLITYSTDRIAVMYAGRIIEVLPSAQVRGGPHHPYTQGLLAAAGLGPAVELLPALPAGRLTAGCPFVGPCPLARAECQDVPPLPQLVGARHVVACHLAQQLGRPAAAEPA